VLVTGGAGFIGSHLVRRFVELGHEVTVLDDFSTGRAENLSSAAPVRIVNGSILDSHAIAEAAQDAELILHLASIVGMRRAHAEPALSMRISDEGTSKLLAATGMVPIVLMSSSSVYGLESSGMVREEDQITAEEALEYDGGKRGYASGKHVLERHGLAAMSTGRRVQILRPFNVVGPRQRDDFGMVLPNFLRRAIAGLPLQVHDDGLQVRSFGSIHTFTDCVFRLLGSENAWRPGATPINIGTSTVTSLIDLAKIVLQETGSNSSIEFIPYKKIFPGKRDVRHRRPDNTRLEQLIGPLEWADIRMIVRDCLAELRVSRAPGFANEIPLVAQKA